MQDNKKEKPKDEKKKKNKYIVKDGDGNIMDVEVPESWIKILEAMNKGEKKKWIPFLKNYGSNIEYNPKFLGKIKKALEFQCPTPRPSCVIAYLLSNKLPNIPRTISINSNVNINSYYSIFIIIIVKNHYLLSYSIWTLQILFEMLKI